MKHTLLIKPEASHDISDAYAWYESERPGLGKNFADAFEQASNVCCSIPNHSPPSWDSFDGFL